MHLVESLVIRDKEDKSNYELGEIINKVILCDAFKVLRKLPKEIFDMVFIDPPYFLQLSKKH
ncbi:MAG: hypothetical protein ACK4LA_04165 [Aquificaceae bacterium]